MLAATAVPLSTPVFSLRMLVARISTNLQELITTLLQFAIWFAAFIQRPGLHDESFNLKINNNWVIQNVRNHHYFPM